MGHQEREQLWVERIAQWRHSGLSQRAFAQQHGYPIRQVGYWVRRLGRSEPTAVAMVPVIIKSAVAAPALVLRSPHNWAIEIPSTLGYCSPIAFLEQWRASQGLNQQAA